MQQQRRALLRIAIPLASRLPLACPERHEANQRRREEAGEAVQVHPRHRQEVYELVALIQQPTDQPGKNRTKEHGHRQACDAVHHEVVAHEHAEDGDAKSNDEEAEEASEHLGIRQSAEDAHHEKHDGRQRGRQPNHTVHGQLRNLLVQPSGHRHGEGIVEQHRAHEVRPVVPDDGQLLRIEAFQAESDDELAAAEQQHDEAQDLRERVVLQAERAQWHEHHHGEHVSQGHVYRVGAQVREGHAELGVVCYPFNTRIGRRPHDDLPPRPQLISKGCVAEAVGRDAVHHLRSGHDGRDVLQKEAEEVRHLRHDEPPLPQVVSEHGAVLHILCEVPVARYATHGVC
eukprot:scaffold7031_cov254-Pinguiococcus_pyrenoidosus.AAC.8